jgi:hypothetical protein
VNIIDLLATYNPDDYLDEYTKLQNQLEDDLRKNDPNIICTISNLELQQAFNKEEE